MMPGFKLRALPLAFTTAFVALFTQVLVHRLVMAKLVNNFAFFVISLTMLGFAFSGVVLSRWRERIFENQGTVIVLSAILFAVSLLGSSALFCGAPARDWVASRPEFVRGFLALMPWALLFALPFAGCGLVLGLLLARPDLPTRQIYFADLSGSALGAFAVLPAISQLGVEKSLLLACAIMLGAAFVFTPRRRRLEWTLSLAAAGLVAWAAADSNRVFRMVYPAGSILAQAAAPGSGWQLEHVAWDPLSRIEVTRVTPPDPRNFPYPSLIGENPAFLSRFRRLLTQNNNAFTYAVDYDGRPSSLTGIEQTLYAAAYEVQSVAQPLVLVIGVGGGFDVLNALHFGASRVTGVEVNGATVGILTRTYRDYFRAWVEDPRFRLVHEEGRHFLAETHQRFDVIQLSGVDSASGTPAAAHVFTENYLYTAEAFDLYLSRLTESGVMNMMRPEYAPPREMLRALVTAVGALRRGGIGRPADHIVMLSARSGNFVAMLVKRSPFTDPELERIHAWAAGSRHFGVVAAPRWDAGPPSVYRAFLASGRPEAEAAFVSAYPFDITPAIDNRPFFFRYSFWWHLFPRDPALWAEVPLMELGLVLLFVLIALATALCVWAPLRHLLRLEGRSPGAWRYGVFFAGAGLGYMAVEIAALQKFSLFLGHPNYALSVVLAALLFSSGIGALYSAAIVRAAGHLRFVGYAVGGVILAEYGLALPRVLPHVDWPFPLRCATVCALVAPLGALLGTFLPSGLERLKADHGSLVPWAWGINGTFSVLAPVLAVALSMTWGISALLLSAVPVYLVVGWSLPSAPARVALP
jgi:spermidine synthase